MYQKVKPQIEIKPDIREKFWEKDQVSSCDVMNMLWQQPVVLFVNITDHVHSSHVCIKTLPRYSKSHGIIWFCYSRH